jgi:TatD DNase family protein
VELIDTHCHLDVAEFDPDRQAVLARARANGVTAIVIPGVMAPGWDYLWRFCAGEPDLYPAFGLHPVYLEQHHPADLAALESLLAEQRPVAVGEIGLDYFVTGLDRARQQALFEAQLALARDAALPVILHVRKAHDAVLATLRRIRVPGGIAHAYNGSLQQAQQYVDLGFKLGFGGMVQHRGMRNSPEYLPHCLAALAEVRGESREDLARQTSANARAVLGLDSYLKQSG